MKTYRLFNKASLISYDYSEEEIKKVFETPILWELQKLDKEQHWENDWAIVTKL